MKMQLHFVGIDAYLVDENYHIVDASSLGLPPYELPTQFETNTGNGNSLVQDEAVYTTSPDPSEQDLFYVTYRQAGAGGCTVRIYND